MWITEFIAESCILQPYAKSFVLGKLPGSRYEYQYNLSPLLYNTEGMQEIYYRFNDLVRTEINHWDFQLAGREPSSIPLLSALPMLARKDDHFINSFMIRKQRKSYGFHNYIEGMPNDLPVLIVDDLVNSTDSFRFCRDVIENTTTMKTLPFIFSVLNKEGRDVVHDKYLGPSHKIISVLNKDDINAALA
jgi:orotate phosphoribosyltransferase